MSKNNKRTSQTNSGRPQRSKAKKIYNAVSTIIVAAIFIFLLLLAVMMLWQKQSGKDVSIFGYYMFDVLTESMEPTINTNDVILCKKAELADIKPNAIITFTAPSGPFKGQNVTHRIYEIKYKSDGVTVDYIKTAGDNLYGGDSVKVDDWRLAPSSVKAVYVKTMPAIGAVRNFMKTPAGYVVLIALPLAIVAFLIIFGIIKDRTKLATQKIKEDAAKNITIDNISDEDKKKLLDNYLNLQDTEKGVDVNRNGYIESDVNEVDDIETGGINENKKTDGIGTNGTEADKIVAECAENEIAEVSTENQISDL